MQRNPFQNLSLERLLNWPVWPFFVAVLLSALFKTNQPGNTQWSFLIFEVIKLTLELSPILLFKHFSPVLKRRYFVGLWLLAFIAYPVLLIWLEKTTLSRFDDFGFIWFTETCILFNHWWHSKKKRTFIKYRPSMDAFLLGLVVLGSLVMSLIFSSTPDAINNQPIVIAIDVGYLLNNLSDVLLNWLSFLVMYGMLYTYYYVNRHFLVSKVLAHYGVFKYLWGSALLLLLSFPLFSQLVLWLPVHWGMAVYADAAAHPESATLLASGNYNPFDYDNARLAFLIMAISSPLILAFQWQQKSQQLIELEKQNIQSELQLLQQQVNPHFLFNTLNGLYALCLTKNDNAPQLVLQLANLLRFVVYQGSKDWVTLNDEIQYLQDYLDLQQFRVSQKCQFEVELCAGHHQQQPVAPLLLVMLLENAFKHGVEPSNEKAWLKVELSVQNNQLRFYCGNSVNPNYVPDKPGIGLENLQRRLALIYPDKHQLQVNAEKDAYHVTLTLECQ